MLLSLAIWLQTLSPDWGFLRVFQYLTFRAVMAAMTALILGLWQGLISFAVWPHSRSASRSASTPCKPT